MSMTASRAIAFIARASLLAALALCIPSLARAQSDVIRGRVTNTDDMALVGVRVIATSIPGNVTRETRTDARGNFQIIFPNGTGDYMMGYALIGYVYRQQQVKRLADEDVLIANASLDVVQLDTIAVVAAVQQRVGRNSNTPDVGGTERQVNPDNLPADLQGDLAAMAASLPGVLLVPGIEGGPDGFSVLGLGADQNSVTLNGMEFGANGLPRDAAISTSLATSPYDASRGGFSGANFNIRTGSGSNFRTVGVSMVLNTPQLQWTDRAASALGQQYTNVSLGGRLSGPLVLNKVFYNTSWQLGRQARDNQTLLGTNPVGLQTAGVASDSVNRLVSILQSQNVPGLLGPFQQQRLSDNGSLLGSIDISPPNSSSGSSYGFTLNGNWGRQSPVFGGTTQLGSASGDRFNWGAGVQARHSAYVKLVLTETTVGATLTRNAGDPYLDLPAGRVRVTSAFGDGSSSVQNLIFGGNQSLSSSSRSDQYSFQNTLSWFDEGNKHRVKLTTEARYRGSNSDPSNNLRGTFTFNSLEDLAAGIPASFTRTLSVRERSFGQYVGSISIGDSYRRTQDVQLQYGLRLDASRHQGSPQFNPAVQSSFGLRNDRIPTMLAVSPRLGFSWVLGDADEIRMFFGDARRPRAVVRGGIGIFASANGGPVGSVLDQTGLPSGTQQIVCVGSAAPVPAWELYSDPTAIPTECADGTAGSPFSNTSPNVSLFAPDYAPPRSVRGNLSWRGAVLDGRFNADVEGSYSLNLKRQRTVDLNFDNVARFTLGDESRPVFVAPASIDPASGSIAARDARISQQFARVTQFRSDLTSR
ncbi:MAG TPA: TonB-dependent receptor, partial [Gemmatimonadaceae bacterium]|nr:TonB-dependent receptor [Gemmatimonadaceae bacterium]